MNLNSRLQLIRQRASHNLPLSDAAALLLDTLRKEDSDLGGVAPCGEILAPDSVRVDVAEEPEDENLLDTQLISPLMRQAFGGRLEHDDVPAVALES